MDARVDLEHAAGWYARTAVAPLRRPTLTFDLDVDVCVVGGGFAGLTAALEIARRGWSVALVEAKQIASEASGRNLGFVIPGFQQDIERIVERCGLDHAKVLWALSDDGVEYIRNVIRETNMPGVDPVDGWLDVSKFDVADDMIPHISLLGQDFGIEVEGWPVERVRAALKTDSYFHAIHFPRAFHIHPLNYALGLAAAAEAAGVRIFESTPALAIDPAGVRKRVATPAGRVRANHIVLAANTQLGRVATDLAQTVLPITTYIAVTEPLGERLSDAITYRGAISDSPSADHHYRIVGGDRLMWSGGSTTWQGEPRRYGAWLKQSIQRTYPQLGEIEISDVWAGTMGFTVHRMPQIGEVLPGVWLASGFGGHGLNTTAMAGTMLARAIVENDDAWRLFLPYDLVWAGGTLGRVVRQSTSWWKRKRISLAARGARRRQALLRADEVAEARDRARQARFQPGDPSLPAAAAFDPPGGIQPGGSQATPSEDSRQAPVKSA
jgi:glycine/D-amino acid oxidase-like deaminating enzyme